MRVLTQTWCRVWYRMGTCSSFLYHFLRLRFCVKYAVQQIFWWADHNENADNAKGCRTKLPEHAFGHFRFSTLIQTVSSATEEWLYVGGGIFCLFLIDSMGSVQPPVCTLFFDGHCSREPNRPFDPAPFGRGALVGHRNLARGFSGMFRDQGHPKDHTGASRQILSRIDLTRHHEANH